VAADAAPTFVNWVLLCWASSYKFASRTAQCIMLSSPISPQHVHCIVRGQIVCSRCCQWCHLGLRLCYLWITVTTTTWQTTRHALASGFKLQARWLLLLPTVLSKVLSPSPHGIPAELPSPLPLKTLLRPGCRLRLTTRPLPVAPAPRLSQLTRLRLRPRRRSSIHPCNFKSTDHDEPVYLRVAAFFVDYLYCNLVVNRFLLIPQDL
jgi:hypothetical protein